MPSLYFTDAGNHCGGMLRAVLSWEDCECVLADQPAIRIGSEFPQGSTEDKGLTAVPILCVLPNEATERWRAGFYRVHADFAEIDDRVRKLAD
jgi:hypothetical protein